MIEIIQDVKNNLLARREITCTFKGLAGKMKKLEAVDMIAKQFNLEGKVIIPIKLQNDTGRPMVSGTFYIYDDEKLARTHVKPAIFARLDKVKNGGAKEAAEKPAEKTDKAETKESKEKEPKKDEPKKAEPKEKPEKEIK